MPFLDERPRKPYCTAVSTSADEFDVILDETYEYPRQRRDRAPSPRPGKSGR